jgi:TRAP-type C4-dicarboxylate transport system permease small subunit
MRQALLALDRAIDFLTHSFIVIAVTLLAAMAVLGTVDVLSLNFFGRPVPSATEFSSAMLPIVVMLAMSYAQQQRANITVDLFSKHLPENLRRALLFAALAISAFVFTMLAWGAWRLALDSLSVLETAVAAIRFPVWPTKLIFAAGASVCALQLLKEIAWLAVLGEQRQVRGS